MKHGRWGRFGSWPTPVLAALALSSCQTVGVVGGGPFATTSRSTSASLMSELVPASAPALPSAEPVSRVVVEVEGIDAILHAPAAVDPAFQEDVRDWMRFWTRDQVDYFERYLQRMGRYDRLVVDELGERGLPASLRYLPIVESGYFPEAVSGVGATGLWQLMDPTARELGLTVSSIVDDRRDPVASTVAALDYLQQLHTRFGSWLLALAAYNGGPNRVQRLLERHDAEALPGDEAFIRIRPYLPAETREFLPRFFAAAAIASAPDIHGLASGGALPLRYEEVVVPDATSLDVVARAAEVDEEAIFALNPHYLRGFTPAGEARTVRVPAGTASRFERNFAEIPPEERLSFLEHVVSSGETFTHIARRYGVPVSDLTDMNRGVDPRRLQIGQLLIVPVGGGSVGGGPAVAANPGSHIVSRGESLWTIARRYGISTRALAEANGRSLDAVIQVGEELRIPG